MKMNKIIAAVVTALTLTAATTATHAADWPARPINLVVPFQAGGGADTYARAIAATAREVLGVPVAVVNRPGGGGLIAPNSVMNSRPDGYTMMLTSSGSYLLATMTQDTPIDAIESLDFVAQVGELTTSLMTSKNSPYKTVEDLIAAAKENPDSLKWSHSGRGTFHHIAGVGFLEKNGIIAKDVPFSGGAPSRAALLGGQVDFGFIGIQQLAGFEAQIDGLAVNSSERDEIADTVPSFEELDIPFARVSSPIIVFAPKDTPAEIKAKMETALKEITELPKFAELLANSGTTPIYKTGADAKVGLETMKADVEPLLAELNN